MHKQPELTNPEAEQIKARILKSTLDTKKEIKRLNDLMESNGYSMIIAVSVGADRRGRH